MEDIIDEIPSSGVKNKDFQPKHEEEKTKENLESIGEGSDHSLLIIKELKNLDQNKVNICHVSTSIKNISKTAFHFLELLKKKNARTKHVLYYLTNLFFKGHVFLVLTSLDSLGKWITPK